MVALNADVVGYSRLIADDFESTTATMTLYHDLVETLLAAEGGTLANFVGDSFMAVFDDVADAMRGAIRITTEIEERNAGIPATSRVRFRMGLDMGDVGASGGKFHGDALNIAARIQAVAHPGGISVSGRVYRALDEPALRFRPVGRQKLKNVPDQIAVYDFSGLPSDGHVATDRSSLSLEAPTVAVLPIHAESADDSVRSAAAIIRSEMLHSLAGVPLLEVIDAPTEPGVDHPAATARYILESGVHQVGDQVRVYASLLDVTTMNPVKSHRWAVRADELLGLSEQVAEDVLRTIEVELVVGAPAGLYADLGDAESIEKIYLGWYHLRSDTREGWARAVELFGDVAREHPDKPYGRVLSAYSLWIGAGNEWVPDPQATLVQARDLARESAEIGDPTGMAQAVQAAVLMSQGNVDEAIETMEDLEIVRPTCDITFGLEGSVRRYMGDWEKAVELLDVAMRLTGINKPWYPTVKAVSLFIGERLEEAASIAEAVLEHQPNNLEALMVLAAAQQELGLDRRAEATAQTIRERFPSVDTEAWLDRHPYQRRDLVDRWKDDLASAGASAID
jgi:class 3 adenylate cyclase/tetratricopeptide (TPR) repeat protein